MYRPCDPYMLCGISSRFQLLSPTERQVPHALLTRSPLKLFRRKASVRLACVRHAASVRPEPGSNSQKIVSKLPEGSSNHFLNNLLLAILLKNFRWLKFDFSKLKQFKIVQGVLSSSFTLFNLQGTVSFAVRRGTLGILSQPTQFVNSFFEVFENFL